MRTELETHDIDSISDAVARKLIDHLDVVMQRQRAGLDDLLTVEELSNLIKVKPSVVSLTLLCIWRSSS